METERKLKSEGFYAQLRRVGRTFLFLKPVKLQVVALALAIVGYAVTEVYCVRLLKPVMNALENISPEESGHYSGFWDWISAPAGSGASLRHAIIVLFVMKVVLMTMLWFKTVATAWQSMSMVFYMRAAVYDRLQRVGFSFHDQYASGHLINRALTDLQAVRTFVMTGMSQAIEIVVSVSLYLALLWLECSPKIALAALIPLPFWILAIRRFAVLSQPIYEAQTKASDHMVEVLTENVAGVHVIRAFATEAQERKKFQTASTTVLKHLLDAVWLRVKMIPIIRGIAVGSNIALFAYAAILVQRKQLVVGDLLLIGGAMSQILGRLQGINAISDSYQQAVVSSKRLFDILERPCNTPEREDAAPLLPGAGAVKFHHASFSYEPGFPVVEDVSFNLPAGSIVAIVGPTGSGKTTLAALLGRFYDPDIGSVEIDGQDTRDVTLSSVRESVGYVFQETYLFSDTIARNIAYGDLNSPREKIKEAAKLARADEFIERLPQKYDTMIGEYGASLSGGQKQRLAIARAILHNPRILVLDDALASVDPETESLIREGLERVMKGRTVFLITSRISSARRAHKIVVIERGKVTQQGTHDELMRQDGYYREVASCQFTDDAKVDEHSHMDRMRRMSKRSGRVLHE